jgi:hypothetical protein
MDGEDVRMRQRSNGLCFAFETRERVRIDGEVFREHLDGDVAIEPRVARPIHFAHSTGAHDIDDFVRVQPCSGTQRHRVRTFPETTAAPSRAPRA